MASAKAAGVRAAKAADGMRAAYLAGVLTPAGLRAAVRRVTRALRPLAGSFDCLAFRGMSGALVAPPAAALLGKGMAMVRKADQSHSGMAVEGPADVSAYVVVDDLVCSGATLEAVRDTMTNTHPGCRCLGVMLYNYQGENLLQTVNFFRVRRHFPWLHGASAAARAAELLQVARLRADGRGGAEWEEVVFGRPGEVLPLRPLLDVLFPGPDDGPDRVALRATAAWRSLGVLRRTLAAGA